MPRKSAPPRTQAVLPHQSLPRLLDDERDDPYEPRRKPPPTRCTTCGAVYRKGRWQWAEPTPDDAEGTCPACRRIADRAPAGWLTLTGPYLAQHRDDLLRLARNEEADENSEHPLHRIMDVSESADGVEITTTDIHLPRRIGEALRRAHHGELDFAFGESDYRIRVDWKR